MPAPLTVIIPFYDETAFVHMALWSVLSQGIDGVEVILVNDNPARFSPADIARLNLPAAVQVLHHGANRGLSAARNTGLAAAAGRFVGFLDADDYYVAGGLARMLAAAEASDADITHAQTYLSQPGSPAVQVLTRDAALFTRPRSGAGLTGVEESQFIVSSWSSLYRLEFLDRADLRFDPAQVKFEDRLFVVQAVTAARRIAITGAPARVWRRRGGSISVTPTDAAVHLLQVQLLEKCMAHLRARTAVGLAPRFLKRELFNTLSRLIWDMDLLAAIAAGRDPAYAGLAGRIPALLGPDSFESGFFNDPVARLISRVGKPSRRGVISRTDFFAIHAALRDGRIAEASGLLAARAAPPLPAARPRQAALQANLVLHLGLHKTGSTYIQGQLTAHAGALRGMGILLPATGMERDSAAATRPGGFPGHQGLLRALRGGDEAPFAALREEVARSRCGNVILSCENMVLPFDPDRDALIAALLDRLSMFRAVQPVAIVRRPDRALEALWREVVCLGQRAGARSVAEFSVDHAALLTDLPKLLAPFEARAQVRLADYDAEGGLWPRFLALCGLVPVQIAALPAMPGVARYATPAAPEVALARLVNTLIAQPEARADILRGLFALPPSGAPDAPFLPPADRALLLARFAEVSADWAAARGYTPPLSAWQAALAAEDWQPPAPPSQVMLDRLMAARLFVERPAGVMPAPAPSPLRQNKGVLTIRIRPRPWLVRTLRYLGR